MWCLHLLLSWFTLREATRRVHPGVHRCAGRRRLRESPTVIRVAEGDPYACRDRGAMLHHEFRRGNEAGASELSCCPRGRDRRWYPCLLRTFDARRFLRRNNSVRLRLSSCNGADKPVQFFERNEVEDDLSLACPHFDAYARLKPIRQSALCFRNLSRSRSRRARSFCGRRYRLIATHEVLGLAHRELLLRDTTRQSFLERVFGQTQQSPAVAGGNGAIDKERLN